MKRKIQKILLFFEFKSFGVCKWWANKLGIDSSKVRLAFIYTSFITFGSPLIIYIAMAWILDHKHYFKFQKRRKSTIWEL